MILNLQYLRGLAALMVVAFHVTDSAGRLGSGAALPPFPAGRAGVDVFFAISGFIIWTTTRAEPNGGSFLLRRLVRVAPLYWLLTFALAAAALAALAAPALVSSTVFHLDHFVASLLFVPYPHPTFGIYNPFLFLGWTLNYEIAFYALFALILAAPARLHLGLALASILLVAGTGLALEPAGIAGFYTDPIVLEFAFGLAIGAAYTRGLAPSAPACLAIVASGIVLLLAAAGHPGPRPLLFGVPAALVVAGAVFLERAVGERRVALPALLGDASYSIYLTHLFTLPVVQILWRKLGPAASGPTAWLYIGVATAVCAAGGIVCYRWVEKPLGRLCRLLAKRLYAEGNAAAPVSTTATPLGA